ncbi:MAG TPA: lytic transglycosylase domain-containing protein [Phenylobacterium sp.]|nr:lytic transglycosylase domain-containing protein [Phenylobacterium sp.]
MLEIADDGAVTTYDSPSVFTTEGVQAIVVARPEPVVAASPAVRVAAGDVGGAIAAASQRYGVSRDLIEAVAWQESRYNQAAVSRAGATGVMQLMPGTARELGVDRFDLAQNVHGGAAYLSKMLNRFGGDVRLALAAYNAGPGAVERHGGVPPYAETQAYVAAILGGLAQRALAAAPAVTIGR